MFTNSFLDRSRLVFETPVHAIQEALKDVGSSLASNASQQMFREGTKLLLSRAIYSKQPHFGKNVNSVKNGKQFDRSQLVERKQNDSDSDDEILFGGTNLLGANSLEIDAFVSVGIPSAVLTHLIESFDGDADDNSLHWLAGIGKNVNNVLHVCTESNIMSSCFLARFPPYKKFFRHQHSVQLYRILP